MLNDALYYNTNEREKVFYTEHVSSMQHLISKVNGDCLPLTVTGKFFHRKSEKVSKRFLLPLLGSRFDHFQSVRADSRELMRSLISLFSADGGD